jgi:hypothetical protein
LGIGIVVILKDKEILKPNPTYPTLTTISFVISSITLLRLVNGTKAIGIQIQKTGLLHKPEFDQETNKKQKLLW